MSGEKNSIVRCMNCNEVLQGSFCSHCGQKHIHIDDKSLKLVLKQFASALFFLDSKLIISFRDFILHPGQLTRAFIDGQRVRYISPISLFLLINLLFFLFSPVTDFNLSLIDQVTLQPYSDIALSMVKSSMKSMNLTFDEYNELYKVQSTSLSKTIIILNLPVFALLVLLFNVRKRKFYYVDHFIFATHSLAFILLLFLVFFSLDNLFEPFVSKEVNNIVFRTIWVSMLVVYVVYTFQAFRKTYQTKMLETVIATIYMVGLFLFVNYLHRMILFIVVWTIV